MILHPGIDPVAISLGPLQIHWYGVMYLVAFVGGAWLGVTGATGPIRAGSQMKSGTCSSMLLSG